MEMEKIESPATPTVRGALSYSFLSLPFLTFLYFPTLPATKMSFPFMTSFAEPRAVIDYMLYCKKRGVEYKPLFYTFDAFVQEAILKEYITPTEYQELFGGDKKLVDTIFEKQYALEDRCLANMESFVAGEPEWIALREKASMHSADCTRILEFMKYAKAIYVEIDKNDNNEEDPIVIL
jgi:hypothetical protein